jgi:outer membrane lipoprotein SlyB
MSASRVSPIVAIAAVSIILFSLVGVGVMTGLIPSSRSHNAQAVQQAASAPAQAAPAKAKPIVPAARKATEPARVAGAKPAPSPSAPACANCGTVSSVREIEQQGEGSGLGAVAGGVLGGVLGNQVGGGSGRKIATVAGAAGGAFAGHQIEKRMKATRSYEVAVRMDDGAMRHFSYDERPELQPGDKVRVADGRLVN